MEDKDLMKRLRMLSRRDGKSNAEMTIKLGEEVGELSRAVLIVEGADGSKYRGVTYARAVDMVAEEASDVFICLVALIERYDISDDEMKRWVQEKSEKWEAVTGGEEP